MRYAECTVDIDVIPQAAVPYFEVPFFPVHAVPRRCALERRTGVHVRVRRERPT